MSIGPAMVVSKEKADIKGGRKVDEERASVSPYLQWKSTCINEVDKVVKG